MIQMCAYGLLNNTYIWINTRKSHKNFSLNQLRQLIVEIFDNMLTINQILHNISNKNLVYCWIQTPIKVHRKLSTNPNSLIKIFIHNFNKTGLCVYKLYRNLVWTQKHRNVYQFMKGKIQIFVCCMPTVQIFTILVCPNKNRIHG